MKLFSSPDRKFSGALINKKLMYSKILINLPDFKVKMIKIITERPEVIKRDINFSNITLTIL